ncbi:MAG: MFS transporter [Ktedonobacteraceae bacterium]|nr:MFS transporter [Ktedonobacteraceae bacterium]
MSQPHSSLPLTSLPAHHVRHRQPSSIPLRIFATCFTAIMVAVHYTNYSPLITIIRSELHANGSQVGLFSTLLFLGLASAYIPAGILGDRLGARPVLIASCALMGISAILLPLFPNLTWMLVCRIFVGLGSGGAFITGAGIASRLGKHASLGQGLYGGATQAGSGLGLLVTPHLLSWIGWRGSFLFWGILSATAVIIWLFINDGQEIHTPVPINLKKAVHSRAVWTLGLSHLGTFGLGNAIAAWITVYLVMQYKLPLTLAATFGSIVILAGMIFRPLGGILLGRNVIGAIPLLRIGTIMGAVGVALLAIPLRFIPFAIIGLTLVAIGSTIPYTSVFNAAANLRSVGKGVAQALVSDISSPTVIIGPPLIGFLVDRTGNFLLAFGSILLFSCVAITASFLAGPALKREAEDVAQE